MARGLVEKLWLQSCDVAVADANGEAVDGLVNRFDLVRENCFVASADEDLVDSFKGFEVVASLMPRGVHLKVARNCSRAGVPLVAPSYPDQHMRALDGSATKAQLTVLVEMGFDPGIDHATAGQLVNRIHRLRGRVTSSLPATPRLPTPILPRLVSAGSSSSSTRSPISTRPVPAVSPSTRSSHRGGCRSPA